MKPEFAKFIEQSKIVLARADVMLGVGLNEDAARAAYLACFHAAQAYIFERTNKPSKSHSGVQTEFFRLSKEYLRVDTELRKFLSRSYEYKSIADYFSGSDPMTSPEDAEMAVATAKRFVTHFSTLVQVPNHAPTENPKAFL